MSLSFVYPIYNEIENLPRLLSETRRIAEGLFPDYEVILVDDGSADGSAAFIDQLAAGFPNVRALHHTCNRGLGAAIRTGLAHASKDLVLYMDSDFPVSVEQARGALSQLTPETDLLIGYRLGRAEGPRRELMSWTYNRLIRGAFGLRLRDINFAFKLIRLPLLRRLRLRSEGSFIDAELLLQAQRAGAHIREVGLHYHPRVAGASTAASGRVVLGIFREMWNHWRRGRRPGAVRLIVNADDFGLCESVNLGVVQAHRHGVVTSASLLATGDAFDHAAALARHHPALDLGVHLALTQTKPLSPPEEISSLVDRSGRFRATWPAFLNRYLRGAIHGNEVETELRAQIERVRRADITPSHLDSHQHLHMLPGILPIVARLAVEYNIGAIRFPRQTRTVGAWSPLRLPRALQHAALRSVCRLGRPTIRANGLLAPDDFRGFSEGGLWNSQSLARTFADLRPGLTEVCCHPGADDSIDEGLHWGYLWEQELAALTSPEVAAALAQNGITLTTYRDRLAARRQPAA
jgi:hopanoid biosynthesis associated protein HpnK